MKSPPASSASTEARRTLSSVASSPVSRMTLRCAEPQAARDGDDLVVDLPVATREEGAAVDHHVDLVGAGGDRVAHVGELGPERRAARRERRGDARDLTPEPRSASTATSTRSGYTQTAATAGVVSSLGSGRIAFAHSDRTLPGVSAPSSVVRSTMRTAASSAQALLVVLMLRVARPAARASAPTWSTPGRPCRNRRSVVSSRVASCRAATSPPNGLERAMLTASVYEQPGSPDRVCNRMPLSC